MDFSLQERDTVYLSTLGANQLEAYKTCIENQKEISYSFAGNITDAELFFIKIDWRPKDRQASKFQGKDAS
jgi:hypothetical protein